MRVWDFVPQYPPWEAWAVPAAAQSPEVDNPVVRYHSDSSVFCSYVFHSSRRPRRLVVQHHQLILPQRRHRVGLSIAVGKFNLKHVRPENLNDRPHLATAQLLLGNVLRQRDDIQKLDRLRHGFSRLLVTT